MIRKIDIQKFGQFDGFIWNTHCGNDFQFKRMNILYGRNYSGKTTLSRVFRCIEENKLHDRHCDAMFTITLHSGDLINQTQLEKLNKQYDVRVYNSDFVRKNLSWLHRPDGSIDPFTVLGETNVTITLQVKQIETKLGKAEEKAGLLWVHECLKNQAAGKEQDAAKSKQDFNTTLSAKAAEIKNDATVFNVPKYQINALRADIEANAYESILDAETIAAKQKSLFDLQKPALNEIIYKGSKFQSFVSTTQELVERKISVSERIQELVNDSLLEQWVLKGTELHKSKRDSCGFCGSVISDEAWAKLDNHFNKESTQLRAAISAQVNLLERAQQSLSGFVTLSKEDTYSQHQSSLEAVLSEWNTVIEQYNQSLGEMVAQLRAREAKLFEPAAFVAVIDVSERIAETIAKVNTLIASHNLQTSQLGTIQNQVRKELRLSEVMRFAQDIGYSEKVEAIEEASKGVQEFQNRVRESQSAIDSLLAERERLLAETSNEKRGAELVNLHLSGFFGHSQLKLVAEGEGEGLRFQIMRHGKPAFDLSEGETSLISFCYFMATIEDHLKDITAANKLIVYIDDPISSLDSNHVFFMFSLVDTIIAKTKTYAQLFISTHSLDFFKYLKRLTVPGKKEVAYFLLESKGREGKRYSVLADMPKHLKEFVTEFNYLFCQVHKVFTESKTDTAHNEEERQNQIYSFSNNLRKFLECYLFYRFPNTRDPLDNLDKFFKGNIPSLVNRIANEYSHLTQLERGLRPLEFSEIGDCAEIVLTQLFKADEEQYTALCDSVGIEVKLRIKQATPAST